MTTVCIGSCCGPFKPRYRRLVDAIYPTTSIESGLVKTNMQKLTFYAISHPEKLDRIGEYLVARLSRDLYRLKIGLVKISLEAMDQLLQSCHGSLSLNLFVESFLKMVQKLLETNDPELEMLSTDSFVNFANIKEDTPAYHRHYDFFISKFAEMCHRNRENEPKLSRKLRFVGLKVAKNSYMSSKYCTFWKGLRGVIWKMVDDELQSNIWEKEHMKKIIPSILYNLHATELSDAEDGEALASSQVENDNGNDYSNPSALSDQCLRELVGKASFGSIRSVLLPILNHCDLHQLWTPSHFAVAFFKAVMFSVQSRYSYVVIQTLIGHLDERVCCDASIRIGMATVLSAIVPIAGTSIGPCLLEIFNSLLRHMRASIEFQLSPECPSVDQEKLYQDTLINAMGDFANSLPDYQKVEIMLFTINKVPAINGANAKVSDGFLKHVLVKTLLKVATKYKTGYFATVMTSSFLRPLLKLALVDDVQVRLLIQQILHSLFDRHDNLAILHSLRFVPNIEQLELNMDKWSRADEMFMSKNAAVLVGTLYRSLVSVGGMDDSPGNTDAVLCTMSLLCVEMGFDQVQLELFRLAFALQSAALDSDTNISVLNRARIHNLVAKYLNLSCQLLSDSVLIQHVKQVADSRRERAHPCLNLFVSNTLLVDVDKMDSLHMDDDVSLHFDRSLFVEVFERVGKQDARLTVGFPPKFDVNFSLVDDEFTQLLGNTDGTSALSLDGVSVGSSPDVSKDRSRRNTLFVAGGCCKDELQSIPTIERLQQSINESKDSLDTVEREKTEHLVCLFRTTDFGRLVAMTKEEANDPRANVRMVLERVRDKQMIENDIGAKRTRINNIFQFDFPEKNCLEFVI